MARIHRQDLKHDEFVDSVDHLWAYLEEHGRRLGLIALLVVLGSASIGAYIWNSRAQEEAAQILLTGAATTFNAQVQVGLPPLPGEESSVFSSEEAKWAAATEKFAAIYEQYPGTHAGLVARHYEGVSRYRAGESENGLAILEEVTHSGNQDAAALAKLHLAGFYLEANRAEDAESLYRDLIDHPSTTVPRAMAQMDLAAMLSADQPYEARELYEAIQADNPESVLSAAASRRMELLPKKVVAPESVTDEENKDGAEDEGAENE